MRKLVRILQFLWLLPVTIPVWLFYILPLWLIWRDLKYTGSPDFLVAAFVLAKKDLEPWHVKLWRDWAGWGGPCVLILRVYEGATPAEIQRTTLHELKHVWQQFCLGIFFYPAYIVESIYIWLACKQLHAYHDNWFEREARRAAGQPVLIPQHLWMHGRHDRWPWW